LANFCSRLDITPTITEFHDKEDQSNPDLCISDQFSDIEDESELKTFARALQTAQTIALKKGNNKKKRIYSKTSKRTLKRRAKFCTKLASEGFLPVDKYWALKPEGNISKRTDANTLTPELDIIHAVREESEESEANTAARETCSYSVINNTSEVGSEESSKESLPTHNILLHRRHWAHMESKESTRDNDNDDDSGVGDYARQSMSESKTNDKETLTTSDHLDALRHEVLAHQEISKQTPGSTSQVLGDRSKLQEASTQLTKEAKRNDLDVIIRAHVVAMIGLLNIYTDENLGYSWRKASEVVAKTQGRGTNHARRICEWAMGFLRWRDLPLHRMNWKRSTILDDEDLAEEIKTRMMKKGNSLKAEDVVEIVASPEIQAIFALKGISKPLISIKTVLRWLEKMGWSYGKLKNGMYLDGHERSDVVEYRQEFVERWMGHE
jgi:hypothetical protein